MPLHDRAWDGIQIIVLDSKPMRPAAIEQAIAAASPSVELQVESFEAYEPAYRFCKECKRVGLVILSESFEGLPFQKVFRELGKHYLNLGFPAYGVITYDGAPNAFAAATVGKEKHLLSYRPVDGFLRSKEIHSILDELWSEYTQRFEEEVIPPSIQESILSVCEDRLTPGATSFISRTLQVLLSNANVSWIENVASQWAPFISVAREVSPSFFKPHPVLSKLVDLAGPKDKVDLSLESTLNNASGSTPVHQKAVRLALVLNSAREAGRLAEFLESLTKDLKVGSPYVLRQVQKSKSRILAFSEEAVRPKIAQGG